MSFLKKLFGGGDKKPPPPRRQPSGAATPQGRRPAEARTPPAESSTATAPAAASDVAGMAPKELARAVASHDADTRRRAAARLGELKDRSAMRPLMAAFMNYGDPEILQALAVYGKELTPAVSRDASDVSIVGVRRVRLLQLLGATGDPDAAAPVREHMDDLDPAIHVTACIALADLGDTQGLDHLAADLKRTDATLRTMALEALRGRPEKTAQVAVAEHVERYLAEAGAIPSAIEIFAPRLEERDISLVDLVLRHVRDTPHSLTVITGSEAIGMATNQREALIAGLPDHIVRLNTRRAAPEEQIAELEAARDAAAADATTRQVVLGALPALQDRIPLPHFLVRGSGGSYTAKTILVDPHESRIVIEWFRYIDEKAEVPTDLEVILGISTPERSGVSEEELLIYRLSPPDQKDLFPRAYLAHL
jgi:HEAT repeat protein